MYFQEGKRGIALGFALVLFGFAIPLLMVLQIVQASFALSFLAYAASVSGLLLGLIGAAQYGRRGSPDPARRG